MNRQSKRVAFTLIELLTVMAIITLLIGILTPALSASRNRATKTAIKAQINAMSAGLEAFKSDQDEFPPSNPNLITSDPDNINSQLAPQKVAWEVSNGTNDLSGAHLLVDALVGRDFLGYDPKAPEVGSTIYNRWDPTNDRREPYIPVDGVSVTSFNDPAEDGNGIIPEDFGPTLPNIDGLDVPVFRDKFGWPILYYRASPTQNQNTPIIQTVDPTSTNFGDGVYDGFDNRAFTSYTSSPNPHRIKDADGFLTDPGVGTSFALETLQNVTNGGMFAEFIRSIRASTYEPATVGSPRLIFRPRPVKPDRFILLSAGKDGRYGNLDDIANFNVQSTER